MGRTKGSKNKPSQDAQKAVYGKEKEPAMPSFSPTAEIAEMAVVPVNVASFDTCLYHEDDEPRVFKKGEVIPAGWVDTPAKLNRSRWTVDPTTGAWVKGEK